MRNISPQPPLSTVKAQYRASLRFSHWWFKVQFRNSNSPGLLTLVSWATVNGGVWWMSVRVKQILDLEATRDHLVHAGKMIWVQAG